MLSHAYKEQIKDVWPDKLLYASIMLFVMAVVGFLFAAFLVIFDPNTSKVPDVLQPWQPWVVAALSGMSAVCGFVALKRLKTMWAWVGAASGFLSAGLFGLESAFAIVAAGFLVLSMREREEQRLEGKVLTIYDWPDKSLAASLLDLLAGVVCLGWGALVYSGRVTFGGDASATIGLAQMAIGLLCLVAAFGLYHQKFAWLGFVASALAIASGGAYVLAPGLGIAAIACLALAMREGEFHPHVHD